MPPAAARPFRRRRLVVPASLVALSLTGLGIASSGALFTDSAGVDGNAFSAGTVDISTQPTTDAFTITNMAPGDVVTEPVTVRNDGSLGLRYAMTSTATGSLAPALTLQVKTGVTDCSTSGFAATGTSLYDQAAPIGTADGMKVLGDSHQGSDTGDRTLVAGASEVLCFQVTLPGSSTRNEYQATSASATFTFNAEQTANNGDAGSSPAPVRVLAAPANMKVAMVARSAYAVSWTAPTEADGVAVYRSNDEQPAWNEIADVPVAQSTFTDTAPGTDPSYSLVAYSEDSAGARAATSGTPGTTDGSVVTTIDPSGTLTALNSSSRTLYTMTYDPDNGYLYGTDRNTGLYKVSTTTGAESLVISGLIYTVAYNPSNHLLYYTSSVSSGMNVTRYNPDTQGKTTFSKYTLHTTTYGIAYDPDNDSMYFTENTGSSTTVGDLWRAPSSATTTTEVGYTHANTYGLAYTPDTGYLYASSDNGNLLKIDPSSGTQSVFATGFGQVRGVAYDSDNHYLYVGDSNGAVWRVNPVTGDKKLLASNMANSGGMVYSPSTGYLYFFGNKSYVYAMVP